MSNPVLPPQRVAATRRVLLALAAVAGVTAASVVLSSQVVADFLREGPIRITSIEGDALRAVLGGGTLAATAIAVTAFWRRVRLLEAGVAVLALAGGLFLIHALLMPAAALIAAAAATDLGGRLPRERIRQWGPRQRPAVWGVGGIIAAAAAVGLVWLSVWLLQPLFDEGERVDESLGFMVEGLQQPAVADAASTGDSAESTSSESAAGDDRPGPSATGTLIARGELMGADAFHTGSGVVLLVTAPDGTTILRFQDYAVRNGPDLHVYLTPDPSGDVHAPGAIDLGEVRATQGFVNYDVPAGIDPTTFRAVVIYCQPFSVTFATAELR